MPNTTNTNVQTKKRAAYGFALDFPEQFTMRQLRNLKGRKIQYITLYKRVQKAIAEGVVIPIDKMPHADGRKGAWELVYQRVNAKTVAVTAPANVTA